MKDYKILSIDIDFLFKDCVKYQQFQDEDLTPEQSWQLVKWKYGDKFEFDKLSYLWLKKFIEDTCKNVKKVFIIEEHDEIIDVMKNDIKCELGTCINIDNHHDVTYHEDDTNLTIENWVRYARYYNLIYNYVWIHQDLSQCIGDMPMLFQKINWKDVSVDSVGDFDYVVICLSKYFTPIEYWYLQDEIKDWVQEVMKDEGDIIQKSNAQIE